jgi:hypothetical protein
MESVEIIQLELYDGSQTAERRERHGFSDAGAYVNTNHHLNKHLGS